MTSLTQLQPIIHGNMKYTIDLIDESIIQGPDNRLVFLVAVIAFLNGMTQRITILVKQYTAYHHIKSRQIVKHSHNTCLYLLWPITSPTREQFRRCAFFVYANKELYLICSPHNSPGWWWVPGTILWAASPYKYQCEGAFITIHTSSSEDIVYLWQMELYYTKF